MNLLLQAEFKSLKIYTPEEKTKYIVTDGRYYSASYYRFGFWCANGLRLAGSFGWYDLAFEPTHFAEIKIEEIE